MTPTTPSTAPCGQLNRKQIEEILNGAGFTDEAKTSLCRLALVGLAGKNMPTWKDFINSRKLVAYDGTFTAGTFWVKLTDDGPQISKEVYETIAEALLSAQSAPDVAKAVAFYEKRMDIISLLTDIAPMLDVIKGEWSAEGVWSPWDQGLCDRITLQLFDLTKDKPNG